MKSPIRWINIAGKSTSLLLGLIVPLAGCATLLSGAPTAGETVRIKQWLERCDIVALDEATIIKLASFPSTGRGRLAELARPGNVDVIGLGDVLQISIYEVGSKLFGGRSPVMNAFTPAIDSDD